MNYLFLERSLSKLSDADKQLPVIIAMGERVYTVKSVYVIKENLYTHPMLEGAFTESEIPELEEEFDMDLSGYNKTLLHDKGQLILDCDDFGNESVNKNPPIESWWSTLLRMFGH